jgi:hypothetical protein
LLDDDADGNTRNDSEIGTVSGSDVDGKNNMSSLGPVMVSFRLLVSGIGMGKWYHLNLDSDQLLSRVIQNPVISDIRYRRGTGSLLPA